MTVSLYLLPVFKRHPHKLFQGSYLRSSVCLHCGQWLGARQSPPISWTGHCQLASDLYDNLYLRLHHLRLHGQIRVACDNGCGTMGIQCFVTRLRFLNLR